MPCLVYRGQNYTGGGTTVVANPQTSPTAQLQTVTIGNTTYSVSELVFCYDDDGTLYTDSTKQTAITGDATKVYVATNNNKLYRYDSTEQSFAPVGGGGSLESLSDVELTSLSGGQALEYDGTAEKWVNVAKKAVDTPTFSEASTRANLSGSGENMATILGKIKKWFSDLKSHSFATLYDDTLAVGTFQGVDYFYSKCTKSTWDENTSILTLDTMQNASVAMEQQVFIPQVDIAEKTDNTPYLYRPSVANGDRVNEEYVGGSVGWNQLVNPTPSTVNSLTVTCSNGKYSISGTASANGGRNTAQAAQFPMLKDHVYIWMRGSVTGTNQVNWYISDTSYHSVFEIAKRAVFAMKPSSDFTAVLGFNSANGTQYSESYTVMISDLTVLFGTTIADYAYTLETQTAGSGVQWLKDNGFFTESYYPYNAGSIESVKLGTKNYYDANDNLISTYTLGTDTLRGIFKLVDNKIVADGDVKTSDGKINRNFIEDTNLGSLNWEKLSSFGSGGDAFATTNFTDGKIPSSENNGAELVCPKYKTVPRNTLYGSSEKAIAISATGRIIIRDTSYSDAASFKTAMNGVYITCRAATPATEQSSSYTLPQICDKNGTEEFVTDSIIPIGHNSTYYNYPDYMETGEYKSFRDRVDYAEEKAKWHQVGIYANGDTITIDGYYNEIMLVPNHYSGTTLLACAAPAIFPFELFKSITLQNSTESERIDITPAGVVGVTGTYFSNVTVFVR